MNIYYRLPKNLEDMNSAIHRVYLYKFRLYYNYGSQLYIRRCLKNYFHEWNFTSQYSYETVLGMENFN